MNAVQPIPDDYPRVTPYLHVVGAADALEFYRNVFGATERGGRMEGPDGTVMHAEIEIGSSLIMVADEFPDMDAYAPGHFGGTPVSIHVYVEDAEATFAAALAAGATSLNDVADQFYGDRIGTFKDPWGHKWHVSSRVEEVSEEEMRKRMAAQQQS
ncbi:VOC family protein [Glycomyces sp. NPDC048151]|uniref:VOC family protein n=1 Tax=Glycomyces sp. NPDC048151 TaxID=3364002 RepID=UPI003715BFBE